MSVLPNHHVSHHDKTDHVHDDDVYSHVMLPRTKQVLIQSWLILPSDDRIKKPGNGAAVAKGNTVVVHATGVVKA